MKVIGWILAWVLLSPMAKADLLSCSGADIETSSIKLHFKSEGFSRAETFTATVIQGPFAPGDLLHFVRDSWGWIAQVEDDAYSAISLSINFNHVNDRGIAPAVVLLKRHRGAPVTLSSRCLIRNP